MSSLSKKVICPYYNVLLGLLDCLNFYVRNPAVRVIYTILLFNIFILYVLCLSNVRFTECSINAWFGVRSTVAS